MRVTINGHVVVAEPPAELVQATAALLSPTSEDLKLTLRERIEKFEALAKQQPQMDIPVKHKFIPGLYRREVTFPKGFLGTGKVHLESHMDEMISGEMLVVTEEGVKHLVAPCSLVTVPGKKKFGYALKDTTWVTFHPTECTTVEEVEAEIMCDDWTDYELQGECVDITDFHAAIAELGFTPEQVRAMSEDTLDCIAVYDPKVCLMVSDIQGVGLFARLPLVAGTLILARTADNERTAAGRYTNHAKYPNCEMIAKNGSIYLRLLKSACPGDELTCDYRTSVALVRSLACQV